MTEQLIGAPAQPRGLLSTLAFVLRYPHRFFVTGEPFPTPVRPLVFASAMHAAQFGGGMMQDVPAGTTWGDRLQFFAIGVLIGPFSALLQIYFTAVLAHPALHLLGARGRFKDTVAALAFASAPLVLGLVPFTTIFSVSWFIGLSVMALGRVHGVGPLRAMAAYAMCVAVPVLTAVGLRAFVVEAFKVPSGSMSPTIQVSDHIFAIKGAYGVFSKGQPRRGDVIVFRTPDPSGGVAEEYVKRVVGLPGDVIEVEDGRPVIGGVPVPRCRVSVMRMPTDDPGEGEVYVEVLDGRPHLALYDNDLRAVGRRQGPYIVQPSEVFVMGDNRHNARDSREWFSGRGGGVPFENIKGRAAVIWFPVDRFGLSLGGAELGKDAPPALLANLERCLAELR